jgi:hypothetical protein
MEAHMDISDKKVCEELLWDLVCYEMFCGRLSPEMKHLLEMHLEQCLHCRHKIHAFMHMLQAPAIVRNFG